MKWRNKITGLVVNTDRDLEYPWELVDTPKFERESPYDDMAFDESTCAECGFEAASPAGLTVHQRVHPDEEE